MKGEKSLNQHNRVKIEKKKKNARFFYTLHSQLNGSILG